MTDVDPSNEIKQQLSSLMDGELEAQPARFLLRRLEAEPQLRDSWSRWHVVRGCLRGEAAGRLRDDFAATISAALASESVPRAAIGAQVLRWAGGLAVAASVAVAALLAVPMVGSPPSDAGSSAIASSSSTPAAAPASLIAASSLTERDLRPDLGRVAQAVARPQPDPRAMAPALRLDPQLQGYMLRHSAVLSGQAQSSYLPLLPVVAPVRPWSMPAAAGIEDASH